MSPQPPKGASPTKKSYRNGVRVKSISAAKDAASDIAQPVLTDTRSGPTPPVTLKRNAVQTPTVGAKTVETPATEETVPLLRHTPNTRTLALRDARETSIQGIGWI